MKHAATVALILALSGCSSDTRIHRHDWVCVGVGAHVDHTTVVTQPPASPPAKCEPKKDGDDRATDPGDKSEEEGESW